MSSTTNFQEWLDGTDLSDYNDVYSLYCSVSNVANFGSYDTVKADRGGYVVTSCDNDMSLYLASEIARETFLNVIEDTYCEDMGIEGYYGYHHAMENDD